MWSIVSLYVSSDLPWTTLGWPVHPRQLLQETCGYLILNFFGMCLIAAHANGKVFRWGDVRLFQGLGRISYGFYLLHYPVVLLANDFCKRPLNAHEIAYLCDCYFITIALALLSYYLVRVPSAEIRKRPNRASFQTPRIADTVVRIRSVPSSYPRTSDLTF